MTVAEYARWCGDINNSSGDELLGATWGELEDSLQVRADEYRRIEGQIPDEAALLTFHRTWRGALQTYIEFARQQDEDEIANLFALLSPGLIAAGSVEAAEALLTPRTRATLVSTGCIDEEDDSAEQQDDQPTSTTLNDAITLSRG